MGLKKNTDNFIEANGMLIGLKKDFKAKEVFIKKLLENNILEKDVCYYNDSIIETDDAYLYIGN
ncbi:hypothetical protein [Cetobacterium sp.]|uniref:hypothetical protein n=1 Tax=Cetobacterium sp. TaxID=2071632 RepID=UPI003EE80E84